MSFFIQREIFDRMDTKTPSRHHFTHGAVACGQNTRTYFTWKLNISYVLQLFSCSHKVQSKAWVSTKIKKGGVSLSIQDFLSSWVKERNETRKVIDSCIGAHCNPTCPDKIVFLDTADIWGKIVKSVIIGLSLVITVVCCALKGSFMAYYLYLTRRQDKYLNDSAASETRKEVEFSY